MENNQEINKEHEDAINEYLKKEEVIAEIEKIKANPYYFVKKYMIINGKPPEIAMTEEEYNSLINQLKNKDNG
jgi:hypothetical protein